jgi:hypothetical protein
MNEEAGFCGGPAIFRWLLFHRSHRRRDDGRPRRLLPLIRTGLGGLADRLGVQQFGKLRVGLGKLVEHAPA